MALQLLTTVTETSTLIVPTTVTSFVPTTTTSFLPVTSTVVQTLRETVTSVPPPVTFTVTRSETLTVTPSQTSTTRTLRTVTPTLDPGNVILNTTMCTYVPVPYVLPYDNSTAATVFNIELLRCSPHDTYDAVFVRAAQRWMSIISADVEDVFVGQPPVDNCLVVYDFVAAKYVNVMSCAGNVDDLIIAFTVGPIDGTNSILGAASFWYYRDGGQNPYLPLTGFMVFDEVDVAGLAAGGFLDAVIQHEMGHVLGIGTIWPEKNLIQPADCDTRVSYGQSVAGARFLGANANASLSLVDPSGSLGQPYVPVHDSTGSGSVGTSCSHWKESSFRQELMTGFLSSNGNPLSYLTAFSLRDLGYSIDANSTGIDKDWNLATSQPDQMPGAPVEVTARLEGCTDLPKPMGHMGINPARRR
ncbi:hypothetical protein DFJ74DRAFT_678897 [Hyaloraphidium curvatum]|nr:hypothetical protein DFJ74DRAFT_678897 [Hyaloraphidium curvatum]